jgi:hypothetical protein
MANWQRESNMSNREPGEIVWTDQKGGRGGRGQGNPGAGRGRGQGQGGGRMGGGGFCLCPKCGQREPHQAGTPCLQMRCPSCGTAMVREGSPHHQEIERRRSSGDLES